MTYERLIHEYLDEGLNEEMQQQLFSQLSHDESLRLEFNKQMKLHLLAKEDFEATAPSIELTNRVFQSAGFSVPFATIPGFKVSYLFGILPILILLYSVTNTEFNFNEYFKLSKQESNFAVNEDFDRLNQTAIINAVTQNVDDFTNSEKTSDNSNKINNSNSELTKATYFIAEDKSSNKNIGNSSKKSSNKNSANLASNSKSDKVSYLYEKDMDYMGKPFHFISSSKIKPSLISVEKVNKSSLSISSKKNMNIKNMNIKNMNVDEPLLNLTSQIGPDNSMLFISTRAINNSSLYKQIGDFGLPIANYAISLGYKANPNWVILFEYSNENYFQEFTNTNSLGINYLTRQNPTLNLYMLGVRYNATEMFNSNIVFPFLQANIGFANIGAVSRIMTGLEYRISENLSLIPALEISGLVYSNQFGNYISNNNGFSLGLSYNFINRD